MYNVFTECALPLNTRTENDIAKFKSQIKDFSSKLKILFNLAIILIKFTNNLVGWAHLSETRQHIYGNLLQKSTG